MAWIIGEANAEEISRIKAAGYQIDEILTEDRERHIFGNTRKENLAENPVDSMIMLYVDCDIPDLLNMGG